MSVELKPCPFCGRNCNGKWETKSNTTSMWNNRPRERTPEKEAVLRAAVALHALRGAPLTNAAFVAIEKALMNVDAAVDALLAVEPKWGG